MAARLRIGCSSLIVVLILLQVLTTTHCCVESRNDVPRTPRPEKELIKKHGERTARKITSPVDRIFPETPPRNLDPSHQRDEAGDDRQNSFARLKEDVARVRVRRDSKYVKEAGVADSGKDRRAIDGRKSERFSSKAALPLRELRETRDNRASVDREGRSYGPPSQEMREASNYAEEIDGQPAASGKVRSERRDLRRGNEDRESFADQEERSSFYDEFESKDVVKRGISGAEDYEEADEDEDSSEMLEEDAALQEEDSADEEESEASKARGDARVKREQNGETKSESKLENVEAGKESLARSDGNANSGEESSKKRDAKSNGNGNIEKIDVQLSGKEEGNLNDRASKESAPENEEKSSKVSSEGEIENPRQSSISDDKLNGESLKPLNEEAPSVREEDGGKPEEIDSSNDKKIVAESSQPNAASRIEESKVIETLNPADGSRIEESIIVKEVPIPSDTFDNAKLRNADALAKQLVPEDDYEKHVEEQIQRKIDSIKEEIKREIEQKQRAREIERNNEKFDELRTQEGEDEDEDDEQSFEGEQPEKLRSVSKRSSTNESKGRATMRRKRQGKSDAEKNKNLVGRDSSVEQSAHSNHENIRKRSAPGYAATAENSKKISSAASPMKKREYARQVILVKDDQGGGRKRRRRRRRRSRSPALMPEEARVQVERKLPAELTLDAGLRSVLGDGKSASPSMVAEDEKAEQDSPVGRRSESEASLTRGSEELSPRLASEYKEAFGGLQGETGVALARFKRIKRVLRT